MRIVLVNTGAITRFLRIASLVMLLVAVGLLSAVLTMQFAIHGAEVQVPELKGMTTADARSVAAGLGLRLDVDNRYYSADVAAGHILSQSPAAGTVVRHEWRVRVAESLGAQRVDVPDTVGANERVAELELRRAGLEVGEVAHLPWSSAAEGTVLAQDPPPHAQGIEQPSVSLLVADPDDETPDGYVMPDLTGLPLASAEAALTKVGIKTAPPGYVGEQAPPEGSGDAPIRPPMKPGDVVAQSPSAGTRVDQTTMVKLTVAR
jgi:beta-lactam-binding protein with PASTA domain